MKKALYFPVVNYGSNVVRRSQPCEQPSSPDPQVASAGIYLLPPCAGKFVFRALTGPPADRSTAGAAARRSASQLPCQTRGLRPNGCIERAPTRVPALLRRLFHRRASDTALTFPR